MPAHAKSDGNVGIVGFCFGGGVANRMVARPELKAVVVLLWAAVPADEVPAIHAPLLLHYVELDERVNAKIAAYEAA
jgi:carboxymethylenebutenolidase